MHDTGASNMCITDRDIATISGPCRVPTYPEPPVLGMARVRTPTGPSHFHPYILVEATIIEPSTGRRMTNWNRIQTRVKPYRDGATDRFFNMRLDGPLIPSTTYWVRVPDNTNRIHAGTNKSWLRRLPRGQPIADRIGPAQMPLYATLKAHIDLSPYPPPYGRPGRLSPPHVEHQVWRRHY